MIFGKILRVLDLKSFKQLVFLFLLLTPCFVYAQNEQALQKLLSPFSEIEHIKLTYKEKRFSLFFKYPRLYQGYIEYISPETFIKYIETPEKKKIVISQDKLILYNYDLESSGKAIKKEVSLNNYPQFKQLRALFFGLFKGQSSELTHYFKYKITHLSDQQTLLELKSLINDPFTQEKQQKHTDKKIDVFFQDKHITKIIMTGLGGERSELYFTDVIIKSRLNR